MLAFNSTNFLQRAFADTSYKDIFEKVLKKYELELENIFKSYGYVRKRYGKSLKEPIYTFNDEQLPLKLITAVWHAIVPLPLPQQEIELRSIFFPKILSNAHKYILTHLLVRLALNDYKHGIHASIGHCYGYTYAYIANKHSSSSAAFIQNISALLPRLRLYFQSNSQILGHALHEKKSIFPVFDLRMKAILNGNQEEFIVEHGLPALEILKGRIATMLVTKDEFFCQTKSLRPTEKEVKAIDELSEQVHYFPLKNHQLKIELFLVYELMKNRDKFSELLDSCDAIDFFSLIEPQVLLKVIELLKSAGLDQGVDTATLIEFLYSSKPLRSKEIAAKIALLLGCQSIAQLYDPQFKDSIKHNLGLYLDIIYEIEKKVLTPNFCLKMK